MIASLEGVLQKKEENRIIVGVGGVGYEVKIPTSTFYSLGNINDNVRLKIYTHVREDRINLYGFVDDLSKKFFEKLITISGIGPSLALSILSGGSIKELTSYIRNENIPALKEIPGIGKKTAERIILEMKSKLDELPRAEAEKKGVSSEEEERYQELTSALMNLGYSASEARNTLNDVETSPDEDFESILKKSLRHLGAN